jgi:hypothetical protein
MKKGLTLVLILAFMTAFCQGEDIKKPNLYDLPHNGLILTTDYIWSVTIGYQRLEPLSNYVAALGRVGIGYTAESGNDATINGDLSLLIGGNRHFGELGVGWYGPLTDSAGFALFPNLTYRYMGEKGFYTKIGVRMSIYTQEEDLDAAWEGQYGVWPLLHVGYVWYF